MIKKFKRYISLILCMLILGTTWKVSAAEEQPEKDGIFYLEENSGISTFSLSNDSSLPVDNVRYNKFLKQKEFWEDHSCPNLGMGMKYINCDGDNPDGMGKWRYVYCLEVDKDSPSEGVNLTFDGWTNKKILYALYYGAVYYGQPCRYQEYSTGDWMMDYFVTQVAVHILNGEFTLDDARRGMDQSSASEQDKQTALTCIDKILQGAQRPYNYDFMTDDGFVDISGSRFALKKNGDGGWTYDNDMYVSDDSISSEFETFSGYPFHEQLLDYNIILPQDISYRQNGEAVYSDFNVEVDPENYEWWQLTGKEIPIEVTASVPRYWGAGIYRLPGSDKVQSVCFITCLDRTDIVEFTAREKLTIPQKSMPLEICKKDAATGQALSGAVFSLWGYDGEKYSIDLGKAADQGDGRYIFQDVKYTDSQGGWFLIREEKGPEGYKDQYVLSSPEEKQEYGWFEGRQVFMDQNGFHSDRINDPLTFYDEKETDKVHSVNIIKKIKADEIVWDHGDPVFFYKVSGNGTDGKNHLYHRAIHFKKEELNQEGDYVYGNVTIENVPAGEYKIQEFPGTMRYILTNVTARTENVNVKISEKGIVNGFMEIEADVTADLKEKDAEVLFENRKIRYDDYSDNCLVVNHIIAG